MKRLNCAEVGIFPECTWSAEGSDDAEIMSKAAQHARDVHGLSDSDLTAERVEAIRSRITEV